MGGLLILFFVALFLDAYIGAIDKFNGTVENTVHVVVWLPLALHILFGIVFGG